MAIIDGMKSLFEWLQIVFVSGLWLALVKVADMANRNQIPLLKRFNGPLHPFWAILLVVLGAAAILYLLFGYHPQPKPPTKDIEERIRNG